MPAFRILVVDDSRDVADILVLLLRLWGYESCAAYSGRQALTVVEQQPPDAVLLDLIMPEMDGIELVRRLRQRPETSQALLVCITGMSEDRYRHALREAGCDHYLLKASPPEELRQLLDSHSPAD